MIGLFDPTFIANAKWNPAYLGSSLLSWWDANYFAYSNAGTTLATNGQGVQQWNSRSASIIASQATSGLRPTYQTNIQNGLPGILFDNTDDVMFSTLTRASVSGSSVWYASVVTPILNSDREYFGWIMNGTTFNQWYCAKLADNKIRSNGYDGSEHVANFFSAASATGVCVINTFNNGGNNEIYRNGVVQQQVASGSPSIDSGQQFQIGKAYNPSECYIHELIVVNGSPTGSQISAISNYLMTRWGIV